jgi:AraC-like DNA-binding protein
MEVSRELIEHQMPQPNPLLVANIRQILDRELADLGKPLTATREVFQIIRTRLVEEAPKIAHVADICGTTERTLRRRLKEEGTTYRNVLESVRKEACEFELKRGTHSIADLAHSLGYSDQSAFTRAFKDWYGVSPSQYIKG